MIHTLLNSLTQRQTLLQSSNNDEHLPALQYSAHSDGQSHPRHSVNVMIEKAGIGEDCIVCEGFDTSARGEG
jgi:hypothetical protein